MLIQRDLLADKDAVSVISGFSVVCGKIWTVASAHTSVLYAAGLAQWYARPNCKHAGLHLAAVAGYSLHLRRHPIVPLALPLPIARAIPQTHQARPVSGRQMSGDDNCSHFGWDTCVLGPFL